MQATKQELTIIKLKESHTDEIGTNNDAAAMFRIWTLLCGGEELRDLTANNRSIL